MPRVFVAILLTLITQSVLSAGPTENATPRSARSFGSDGKWWKCDPLDPAKGCQTGTLASLGLTPDEQAFVREKLDRIDWHPRKVDKQSVHKLLGSRPNIDDSLKQIYQGAGVGADPNRVVSIYYVNGYVSTIHWFQPNRFLLTKAHSF